jgi:glutamine synthetase
MDAIRIEHRVAGADANPYLVTSAVLAGIHHGLSGEIEPPPPSTGDAAGQTERELPSGWLHAIEALEDGEVMKGYLGERFLDIFTACRRFERDAFASHVTSLEYDWYLRAV